MTVFIIRRLMQAALVIFAMSLIVFVGISVVSNPVDILINPDFTQEEYERAVRALGLDRPLHEQYFVFLGNALRGDLGHSFVFGQPALQLIIQRMPATLELAFVSLIMAIVLGIPLGVYAGLKPDSVAGKTIMGGSILGFSLPTFWVGIMLIMIFAVELGWLPSTGRGPTRELFGIHVSFLTWDGLKYLFLPALNLALTNISLVIRVARAGTREAALQDYVRFARAKGLSGNRIVLVHILKNIMIPIVTILGL
ncbi:MAG: ABC transporter permease, partial [Alphaproteobacteria bacterium]